MNLEARHISVRLAGRTIIKDASISVTPGELVALIGPNGAGKSTFLRALAGLLPLASGEICPQQDMKAYARFRAYLGQEPVIHWPVTVERLVSLGRLPHLDAFQKPDAEDRAAIAHAMDVTSVQEFADRPAIHLSAGERARVLLARALATRTPYILADEPVAALDPYHAFGMMELLALEAKAGRGVLVVLHDLNLAARFADRLVLMNKGKVAADGEKDVVLSDRMLANTYGIKVARGPDWLAPVGRVANGD